ncbi:kinase domain protein (macronuclear) [Tetrahymena thermophila SB210]|uniref:Kinase domain protein n=1 Tax=Tetrahymena thermophila (strain SB210) TaxID=312017 RepID=Q235C5_TETTS|nr:kinase domain protein [Tetrahymena thermophila SB210]EAR92178.2 kinase domain protein [Tetrahymena thermophila SB210]|eukprot:XP_001012423.2 kinase domain protein [Tetrahymena thermophila SB210]
MVTKRDKDYISTEKKIQFQGFQQKQESNLKEGYMYKIQQSLVQNQYTNEVKTERSFPKPIEMFNQQRIYQSNSFGQLFFSNQLKKNNDQSDRIKSSNNTQQEIDLQHEAQNIDRNHVIDDIESHSQSKWISQRNINHSIGQFKSENYISYQIQHLQSQIIKPNKEMQQRVKIFYKSCELNRQFWEIFGIQNNKQKRQNNQQISRELVQTQNYEKQRTILKEVNEKNRTVLEVYENKDKVLVKTRIYKECDIFITKKILYSDLKKKDSFEIRFNKEIKILEQLNNNNSEITVEYKGSTKPKEQLNYNNSEITTDESKCPNPKLNESKDTQPLTYEINMVSGMKNLYNIKQQYEISKKYDDYVILLEYAFFQLLSKLNEMHFQEQIAHSDIKPQNIILGYDYNFYFIDFGGSINLKDQNEIQQYLSTYTKIYNYDYFLKMQKYDDWTIQRIIDCETIQLLLTFFNMIDIKDKGYNMLRINGDTEKFKQILEPEFEEFADMLIKYFNYIVKKQNNKNTQIPQNQYHLISNLEGRFEKIMNNQRDILYNEQTNIYELKFINKFSIQIIEYILETTPNCSFDMTNDTLVDLQFNDDQDYSKRKYLDLFPKFCSFFKLKQIPRQTRNSKYSREYIKSSLSTVIFNQDYNIN